MSRKLARRLVPLGAAAMFVALAGAMPASAAIPTPRPIGPDEVFTALVNGRTGQSVINVTCDSTKSGHPVAGQTVEVLAGAVTGPLSASLGFTGATAKEIGAAVGVVEGPIPPIHLLAYGRSATIPVSTVVPCGGSGVVSFIPQPNSSTAIPALVRVTFVPVVTKA
ncbi:hypothetical protein J5X84_24210 [Streptosporangiaceae bacterium NEAU-GS5]|nr:hypothetical protein [Streptosporangiaceae bacterium NEAU-GS5]